MWMVAFTQVIRMKRSFGEDWNNSPTCVKYEISIPQSQIPYVNVQHRRGSRAGGRGEGLEEGGMGLQV